MNNCKVFSIDALIVLIKEKSLLFINDRLSLFNICLKGVVLL